MLKLLPFLLFATLLSAATQAETEVLSTMEAYKQAIMHKDAAALSRILSDDLTYTHSSNLHQDKAAVLESLKGKSVVEAMDFKDLKIRVYGNTAVVTTDIESRGNNSGVVSSTRLHVLHVLVKGPQGWQLVARQATRFPEPAAKK
jgi:ketosteroid isomerase-like protein